MASISAISSSRVTDGPAGQHPQGELGERDDVALGSGSIGRGPLEEVEDVEAPELGPDGLGRGRDQVAHLVERLGPSLARRGPGDAQNPHGFDVSVPRLGLTGGVTREGGTGGRDGVLGIGLALAPPALAVGTVDFDDADPLGLEVAGEPGTIGPGPFDADQLDGAEVGEPPQQLLVAALGGGEALDTEESPSLVQSRSYMDVEVRIDAAGDASCQSGHCHPFVGLGWGDTAPAGRRTGQRRACVRQAPIRSLRPTGGVEWVTGPGRRIERKTVPKDVSRFS